MAENGFLCLYVFVLMCLVFIKIVKFACMVFVLLWIILLLCGCFSFLC